MFDFTKRCEESESDRGQRLRHDQGDEQSVTSLTIWMWTIVGNWSIVSYNNIIVIIIVIIIVVIIVVVTIIAIFVVTITIIVTTVLL